jgi:hypothetical protein
LGLRENIRELTQPKIDLDQIDGYRFALIASGVCNADCYYRGPYGGAVFVLLNAPDVRKQADTSVVRMVNVFTQLISLFAVNHRQAFKRVSRIQGL